MMVINRGKPTCGADRKHACTDCSFCQCCSESRCNLCRNIVARKKPSRGNKEHKPLFQKF